MKAGKGYISHKQIEVNSTLPCPGDDDVKLLPVIDRHAANLRLAQLAIATLVQMGIVELDYSDPQWHMQHEAAAKAIARVFDAVEVKI